MLQKRIIKPFQQIEDDVFYQMVQLTPKSQYYEYEITLNERYKYLKGVAFTSDNGFGSTPDVNSFKFPEVGISKNGRFILNMLPGSFLIKDGHITRNTIDLKEEANGSKLKVHIKDMHVENDDLCVIFILTNKEPKSVLYKYAGIQFNIFNDQPTQYVTYTKQLLLEKDVSEIVGINYFNNNKSASTSTSCIVRDEQYQYFNPLIPRLLKPSHNTEDFIDRIVPQGIPNTLKIYLDATVYGLNNDGYLPLDVHTFGFVYKYKIK
ncbi:MAG: hypothetical protein JXR68_12120 [Bacteroidales bacterium]|nr:hypothetical protein [Bacteroidales bacterium]